MFLLFVLAIIYKAYILRLVKNTIDYMQSSDSQQVLEQSRAVDSQMQEKEEKSKVEVHEQEEKEQVETDFLKS